MDTKQELEELRSRVEKLENAVFAKSKDQKRGSAQQTKFSGPTGGVRLLISKGYFRSKRRFADITAELKAQGYLYSRQAFQESLTRLARPGAPLVTIKEGGTKVYAERK